MEKKDEEKISRLARLPPGSGRNSDGNADSEIARGANCFLLFSALAIRTGCEARRAQTGR